MNAQDVVNQSAQQTARITEGAALNVAFKTPSGQVILDAVTDRLAVKLDSLINDKLTENQLCVIAYEIRAIAQLCGDMGDSIKEATRLVARSTIQDRLRQQRRNQEGSE